MMLPSPYDPGRVLTIGIIGGGQLAKMTAMAAYRLGLRVAIIEHGTPSPAGVMTKLEFPGGWNDPEELDRFTNACDIVTLENEFVAPELLERVAERRLVLPEPRTVALVRDKLVQKQTMARAGIPTPAFAAAQTSDDITAFAAGHGYPVVVKTRTFGYDGYGNALIESARDIAAVWQRFRSGEHPREAAAVGMKAIEQGVAGIKMTKQELFEKAAKTIKKAREETQILMKKGLIEMGEQF